MFFKHIERKCNASAFTQLQNDAFVVVVMCQHGHGRDREHHAEEGCRAGAAGRGADHRRATEVGGFILSASPLQGISSIVTSVRKVGVARTMVSDSPDTV